MYVVQIVTAGYPQPGQLFEIVLLNQGFVVFPPNSFPNHRAKSST